MDYIELYHSLEIFLLIFIRLSSFIFIAPIFGGKNVPSMAKIALAFYISILVYYSAPVEYSIDTQFTIEYGILVMKEMLTGASLGFIVYLVFSCLYLAGQIIDFNLGFSMVNVFDPIAQLQVPLVGNFYYLLLLMVMLVINADLYLIKSVVSSFSVLPLGDATMTAGLYTSIIDFFTVSFILAIKIAAPIMVAMFVLNVALGILVRAVPQMNMFVIGLPIKIILGLLILFITSPVVISIADYMFTMMRDTIIRVLEGMIG